MPIKAVVFDLDGTIATFNVDYKSVRADVRSLLIDAGVPAFDLSTNEAVFEMLGKTEIFLRNRGKPEKTIEDIRGRALDIAEDYELEAAKSTSLLPGAVETLKAIREMKLKIGLCTINSQRSVNHILERFRITDYFDAIVPREKVRHVKPSKEHLEAVLDLLHIDPKDIMAVGDGTSDMRCARELGAMAVGLPTGVSSQENLIRAGANYIITSIIDLAALIGQIEASSKT